MFGWLVTLVGWVWQGLQAAADFAILALQVAYRGLRAFGIAIWDSAGWFYRNVLKPVGEFLDRAYTRLQELYRRFVQPVIDWLNKLSETLRKLYATFLAPLLSAIDGVQRILKLLELFHIQWAYDIDAALQRLENKLSLPLQKAIEAVNWITNRVEAYVLTADNLFQRLTHLRSIARDLDNIGNMHAWRLMNTLTEKQRDGPSGAQSLSTADDQMTFMENVFNGNDADTGIDVEGALTLMEQLFDGSYSPVVPAPDQSA